MTPFATICTQIPMGLCLPSVGSFFNQSVKKPCPGLRIMLQQGQGFLFYRIAAVRYVSPDGERQSAGVQRAVWPPTPFLYLWPWTGARKHI